MSRHERFEHGLERLHEIFHPLAGPRAAATPISALHVHHHPQRSPPLPPRSAGYLSTLLRVPVLTPRLLLSPEASHAAVLDNLADALALIRSGFDHARLGRVGPPQRLAMFAESSGAAIALSVLQRPSVKRESPPLCALALSSPWLDLTCDGGSYIVNEAYDLMSKPALPATPCPPVRKRLSKRSCAR